MSWATLLLLPAVTLGADYGGYELSLRTEQQVRVFSTRTGGSPTVPFLITPTLGAFRRFPKTGFVIGYAPSLQVGNSVGGTNSARPLISHQGRVGIEHRLGNDRRLSLLESGTYGTIDFFLLATAPGAPGVPAAALQTLPTLTPLPYGQTTTDGSIDWRFTRQVSGSVRASYQLGGGLRDSRALIPLQHRAQGAATLDIATSRTDAWVTQLQGGRTTLSSGPRANVAVLTEGWRGLVSRATTLSIAAGASVIDSAASRAGTRFVLIYPAGDIALRSTVKHAGHRYDIEGNVGLAPYFDWITGNAAQRLELSAGMRWTDAADRWGAVTRLRGAVNLVNTQPQPLQGLLAMDLAATYTPRRTLSIEVGSRLLWQRSPQLGNTPFWQWLTYVSFTISERGIF